MREVNRNTKVPKFVRRIELVHKRSIMYYQQQQSHPFLKIVVALPTMVAGCRGKHLKYDMMAASIFLKEYVDSIIDLLMFFVNLEIQILLISSYHL